MTTRFRYSRSAGSRQHPANLLLGLPFSLTLMFILFAHEMGHYLYARHYRVYATPAVLRALSQPDRNAGRFHSHQEPDSLARSAVRYRNRRARSRDSFRPVSRLSDGLSLSHPFAGSAALRHSTRIPTDLSSRGTSAAHRRAALLTVPCIRSRSPHGWECLPLRSTCCPAANSTADTSSFRSRLGCIAGFRCSRSSRSFLFGKYLWIGLVPLGSAAG